MHLPAKHKLLTQCCFNGGRASKTLSQHYNNNSTMVQRVVLDRFVALVSPTAQYFSVFSPKLYWDTRE